jgi:hypothetical protein
MLTPHRRQNAQELYPIFPQLVTKGDDNPGEQLTATSTGVWGVDYEKMGALALQGVKELLDLSDAFKSSLIAWLASASNGIGDFLAKRGHFDELCTKKSDGTEVCASGDQLAAILAGTAAGAPAIGETNGAPASQPASNENDARTTSSTTPASLKVNGNNPAQWPLNQIWNDNLGALFTNAGQSTTIYSTTTVDTTLSGTTTLDYWAEVPSTEHWLHTTRNVVVSAPTNTAPIPPANDNVASSTPEAANYNTPLTPLSSTSTNATSSAQ